MTITREQRQAAGLGAAPQQPGCPPAGSFRVPFPRAQAASQGAQSQAQPAKLPSVMKTIPVGAFLEQVARHPEFIPYERTSRILPTQAWFAPERTPSSYTRFELINEQPGQDRALIVLEYQVLVYGFSGAASYDYVPRGPGRFSGSMGYAVYVAGTSPGLLEYQLVPTPVPLTDKSAYPQQRSNIPKLSDLTAAYFTDVGLLAYGGASGFGRLLQPQNTRKFGATGAPWSHILIDDMSFRIAGAVFRPVESPIAFVEARVAGFTSSKLLVTKLLDDIAATVRQ